MPRGGKRAGSGKPKGYKHKPSQKLLDKEAGRARVRELVLKEVDPLVAAQIAHAKGVSYMVLRKPDGTFARATDEKQIDAACAAGSLSFQIFTQAPNVQAFSDLMNRALDKPADQVQQIEVTGELSIVDVLRKRSARLADPA